MDPHDVAEHAFLRDLPQPEIEAVARVASPREFASGEQLMTQGDFGHCVFLVKTGAADVTVDGNVVHRVGAGDVVGEVAVLSSGRRTASVVAVATGHHRALQAGRVGARSRSARGGRPTPRCHGSAPRAGRGNTGHPGLLTGGPRRSGRGTRWPSGQKCVLSVVTEPLRV